MRVSSFALIFLFGNVFCASSNSINISQQSEQVGYNNDSFQAVPPAPPPNSSSSTQPSTSSSTITTITTPAPTTSTAASSTSTPAPSTSTAAPSTSTAAPITSTVAPITSTAAPINRNRFDAPSFIGGIVLSLGLSGIGFVGWKYYKARTERNYRTL